MKANGTPSKKAPRIEIEGSKLPETEPLTFAELFFQEYDKTNRSCFSRKRGFWNSEKFSYDAAKQHALSHPHSRTAIAFTNAMEFMKFQQTFIDGFKDNTIKTLEDIKIAVGLGADVNMPDSKGLTPIDYALTRGCAELATHLLTMGAKLPPKWLQYSTLKGLTPENRIKILPFLLEKGFDIHSKSIETDFSKNILFDVIKAGKKDLFESILKKIEPENKSSFLHETSLLYTLYRDQSKLKDFEKLIDTYAYLKTQGAKIDSPNKYGQTVLFAAASNPNAIPLISFLLNIGANPNTLNQGQATPFRQAVYSKNHEAVKLFLNYDVEINKLNVEDLRMINEYLNIHKSKLTEHTDKIDELLKKISNRIER
jgi:ankyrin repeat protein